MNIALYGRSDVSLRLCDQNWAMAVSRPSPVLQGHRLVAASCQSVAHLCNVAAVTEDLHHFSVVILHFVQDHGTAGSCIRLAADRISIEDRLVPLVVDMLRPRHEGGQRELGPRFAGQLGFEPIENVFDVLRAVRHLQQGNRVGVADFPVIGQSGCLVDQALVASDLSQPGGAGSRQRRAHSGYVNGRGCHAVISPPASGPTSDRNGFDRVRLTDAKHHLFIDAEHEPRVRGDLQELDRDVGGQDEVNRRAADRNQQARVIGER